MEYTVQKLSRLAGISARALRFYDEIGILHPARVNSSGYRLYGAAQVDRLQQIMFYRELGVSLERIKELLSAPDFDVQQSLREHRTQMMKRRDQLDQLIANLDRTIATNEGRMTMSDKERFEGFKKTMLEENEAQYGAEVRHKYGDEAVEASNRKFQRMSEEEYAAMQRLAEEIHTTLAAAFATGNPGGALAQQAVDLHRRWLSCYWDSYSKEAHAGLGQMYVDDPRFTAYYDAKQPGMAVFLRDAILIYTDLK